MPQTSVGFQSDTPTRPGMALGAGHDKGYIVGGRAVKIVEVTVDTARNAHDYAYTSGGLTTDLAKTGLPKRVSRTILYLRTWVVTSCAAFSATPFVCGWPGIAGPMCS